MYPHRGGRYDVLTQGRAVRTMYLYRGEVRCINTEKGVQFIYTGEGGKMHQHR